MTDHLLGSHSLCGLFDWCLVTSFSTGLPLSVIGGNQVHYCQKAYCENAVCGLCVAVVSVKCMQSGVGCLQALPLSTVLVGQATTSGLCRVVTMAEHVDEPRYVEFQLPKSDEDLQRGQPVWANYVKGVVAFFPHRGCSCDR